MYAEVRKGMYGLPQAGLLAQELLEESQEISPVQIDAQIVDVRDKINAVHVSSR